MAKRAHVYPQASFAATDLADVAIAPAPAGVGVAEALGLARKRNSALIAARLATTPVVADTRIGP